MTARPKKLTELTELTPEDVDRMAAKNEAAFYQP